MTRAVALALIALVAGVLGACGHHESLQMQRYARATLTPGQGLDDIHLGDPIKPFLERFGSGRVSVVAGDDLLAADLRFTAQGLSFRFLATSDCRAALRTGGSSVRALMGLGDGKRFLENFPACAAMQLHSIGAEDSGSGAEPVFAGATVKGSKLRMSRAELFEREGQGIADHATSSVLETADDEKFERFAYVNGLLVYIQRDGKNDQEPAAAHWKLVKMAVIAPFP